MYLFTMRNQKKFYRIKPIKLLITFCYFVAFIMNLTFLILCDFILIKFYLFISNFIIIFYILFSISLARAGKFTSEKQIFNLFYLHLKGLFILVINGFLMGILIQYLNKESSLLIINKFLNNFGFSIEIFKNLKWGFFFFIVLFIFISFSIKIIKWILFNAMLPEESKDFSVRNNWLTRKELKIFYNKFERIIHNLINIKSRLSFLTFIGLIFSFIMSFFQNNFYFEIFNDPNFIEFLINKNLILFLLVYLLFTILICVVKMIIFVRLFFMIKKKVDLILVYCSISFYIERNTAQFWPNIITFGLFFYIWKWTNLFNELVIYFFL